MIHLLTSPLGRCVLQCACVLLGNITLQMYDTTEMEQASLEKPVKIAS